MMEAGKERDVVKYEVYEHKTQYYETDQMGIIHHSNYIRWFEEARVHMMEQMGMGYDMMEAEGIISPVVSIHCEYKSMTRFGETVRIITNLKEYNGIRMTIEYTVLDGAGPIQTASSASSVWRLSLSASE